ncbi:helix-turn-helix transcriptional regulator [Pedobacter sp. MC2016-14]|uniref:helix-turn-helix domain-containing protein n=1 Tax=Pedobacter sp. MC2016-14 TaxID=2897327 RepID=UPI001E4DE522|nr:helix-turn-helix transcriptional regulator [Pedobacter sp. MC2016-14]MCD0489887.1 helix-turn-helix transcriptional regulator [Pedobacter sp. MC2016-14]
MSSKIPLHIKSISQYHKLRGLKAPEHPLISAIDYATIQPSDVDESGGLLFDFYLISVKKGLMGKLKYGQQTYDHDEGVMSFMAPNQLLKIETEKSTLNKRSGWMLLIHPDFIWNTPLAKSIRQYDFFGYAINEALFLSEKEEKVLDAFIENIRQEYQNNIDRFSQNIIIAQVETLLNYAERFYQRQFITRKKFSHQLLEQMEECLEKYFSGNKRTEIGLPTVQYVSAQLNVSAGYLSSVLKSLTGMNTQQHIHERLIEKAKEKLSTTHLSVSEIAYELGFEHSQSFSRFFKKKTMLSALEFRQSFN